MAGPPTQQRYNAKARGSVAGGSHKKRKRPKHNAIDVSTGADLNNGDAIEDGSTPANDDAEGSGRGKMSAKKRKRMDSYVAKKLKNEERAKTLKLLASLAPDASTSAALASSATLGSKPLAPSSAQERLDNREDKLVRKGMERMAKRIDKIGDEDEDSASDEDRKGSGEGGTAQPVKIIPGTASMTKVKSRKSKKASWNPAFLSTQPQSDSSDFDSSESSDSEDSLDEVEDASRSANAIEGASTSESRVQIAVEKDTESLMENKPALPAGSKPAPSISGGALKKGVDGTAIQPRIMPRRQKMPLGRSRQDEESLGESETESESSGSSAALSIHEASDDDDSTSSDDDEDYEQDESEEDDEESSTSGTDEEAAGTNPAVKGKSRSLGFKAWALSQMGQGNSSPASDGRPTPPPFIEQSSKVVSSPPKSAEKPSLAVKQEAYGPLGSKLEIPKAAILQEADSTARPTLKRRASVADSRMNLPIMAEEQAIVEAVRLNPIVIIAGETGSGKTTQVPQMLYEAGFGYKDSANPGMVAVTQPRRVAAVSLSTRVKDELGYTPSSPVVAHQIRYSSTTSPETCIKFMTDGVLLRELSTDFLLSRYSVVIVDEAHERGVNTDVLIGVLSRVAKLREKKWRDHKSQSNSIGSQNGQEDGIKPLRIVIMSATLRIEDFSANPSLFPNPPPVIHIPARQHPVTIHFARRTMSDYITEAYKKVCKIHSRLPSGAVLVFLTGQAEIQGLCRKLEAKYGDAALRKKAQGDSRRDRKGRKTEEQPSNLLDEVSRQDIAVEAEDMEIGNDEDLAADVDDGQAESDPEALESEEEIPDIGLEEVSDTPMHILPLYSLLPHDQQMRVFEPPPPGHRLIIVATNVAETSLTIPGVRYVVDSGRSKERHFDPVSGVQSFQVSWISKASASQRAGRAGRTGPGHVYRLYSSALYEDHFEQYTKPEILRMPIEGVVLSMKAMNLDQIINFPFPTPPDRHALAKAEELLTQLGALERSTQTRMINGIQNEGEKGGKITALGSSMAGYPVSPRFAKMLVIGNQHDCLPYIIAIVACLSVGDPFIHEQSLALGDDGEGEDEEDYELKNLNSITLREREEKKRLRARYFKAQAQFESLGGGKSDLFKMLAAVGAYEYDQTSNFCVQNFLRPKAMQEIQKIRQQISRIANVPMNRINPPTNTQLKVIRQIILSASLDRVAVRLDVALKHPTNFTSSRNVAYRAIGLAAEEEAYIHPTSTAFHRSPPEYLTFQEITRGEKKIYLKGVTTINPGWLAELGKGMCSWSKPQEVTVKGRGMSDKVKEGEREVWVVPHFSNLGVDLPAKKMKQRREGTRWVFVE